MTSFVFRLLSRTTGLVVTGLSSGHSQPAETVKLEADLTAAWFVEAKQSRDERMAWYKEAKFGMFVHWGVYSLPGGVWKGEVKPGFSEHIYRHFRIPFAEYAAEVAGNFNPVEFNADEWVRILKDTGMEYLVITAKHHDGFALWPSAIGEWDIDEASPYEGDPIGALKDACNRHGIHLGFYYSQAQDWSHPFGQRGIQDWPYQPDEKFWWRDPEYKDYVEQSERYIKEKSIPQLVELILRYQPKLIWFDTPDYVPPYQNQMVLKALRYTDPRMVVNGRIGSGMGDYVTTSDQPHDFQHFYRRFSVWEAIPTTNQSYGYHRADHSHKTPAFFIELLAKAAEKGGNLLMNIGPRGDGSFAPEDRAILSAIGDWMAVNGESIHGTTHTPLPMQAWGHVSRKGHLLYLHVTEWPSNGEIALGALDTPIRRSWLLADLERKALPVESLDGSDWLIRAPAHALDPINTVVVVECASDPKGQDLPVIVSPKVSRQLLHIFDGKVEGLELESGNYKENFASGWTRENTDAEASWKIRLLEPGDFTVKIIYVAYVGQDAGTFQVQVSSETFLGDVAQQPVPRRQDMTLYPEQELGTVHLEPGEHEVSISAAEITSESLMAPHGIVFYAN